VDQADLNLLSNYTGATGGWAVLTSSKSGATVGNDIGYAGYIFDAESGLSCVRNRHLHHKLGRWMQRDPAGYIDGMHLYQYVGGWPVRAIDPLGLATLLQGATGSTKADCERCKVKALEDPRVQNLINQIGATSRCRGWKSSRITCKSCPPGKGAYLDPCRLPPGQITLCYNALPATEDCAYYIQALIHELVHALDECSNTTHTPGNCRDWWGNCDNRACSEIRACKASGQCDPTGGKWYDPSRDTDEASCCRRTAAESTSADPNCGDGTAAVDRMWGACWDIESAKHPWVPIKFSGACK
jgi:RHS repeat-associated protein